MKYFLRCTAILFFAIVLAACGDDGGNQDNNGEGWETTEESDVGDSPDVSDSTPDMGTEPDLAPDTGPSGKPNGAECTSDDECEGGVCRTGEDWPGGYCTTDSCGFTCPGEDSSCINDSELGNFCGQACDDDSECRDGYICSAIGLGDDKACIPPTGDADGEPCATDSECQGGTCMTDWPGGFCTTMNCEDQTDCARMGHDNKCLRNPRGPNFCVRMCQENSECRDGYVCRLFHNGEGMCSPDPAQPLDPTVLQEMPFDVTCKATQNGQVTLDYTIAQDTTAYMVTPLDESGRSIAPRSIQRPSGGDIDFGGENWFQSVPSEIYQGGMNPTIVPATDDFATQLETGDHQYTLDAESDEICYYQIEETEPGTVIDFNVYLVGVPGIDAASAPNDTDMQAALDQFDQIWSAANISIGKIRYYDITGDDATRYSVLRSDSDVSDLVTLTTNPGDTIDDVLSINIFFVEAFAMGGAIGISLGLPGPAGLHGTHGSGVAFTSEYLGEQVPSRLSNDLVDGNVFTGQVLAHEVGHYIGLFHTSEQNGYNHDPLDDTPECQQISLQCPDITNLMFPFAGVDHTVVTNDQNFVMGVNPLTKSPPETTDPDSGDGSTGTGTGGN